MKTQLNIKDLVKDNKVKFLYYRQGELWYEVDKEEYERVDYNNIQDGDQYCWCGMWITFMHISISNPDMRGLVIRRPLPKFRFPVPISDCGDGTFLAEDKAIIYMRYIRKYLQELEKE